MDVHVFLSNMSKLGIGYARKNNNFQCRDKTEQAKRTLGVTMIASEYEFDILLQFRIDSKRQSIDEII